MFIQRVVPNGPALLFGLRSLRSTTAGLLVELRPPGTNMSIRAKSHTDLQTVGKSSAEDSFHKSLSMSSSGVSRGGHFGYGVTEEVKVLPRGPRRPIRAVRPVSAVGYGGSFLQINHLQGELVRKRKECEDLKRENKFLSNEIHMERIAMRTENELTMRNLRNMNQELQIQVKELKQKLHHCQQRATFCTRAAEEAQESRGEAERSRASAEARALGCQRDKETAEADQRRLSEDLQLLKKQMSLRRKAAAAEEERQRANQAQREAEDERRQANKERQEKTAECLSWREKHHELANILQAHEDLKAQRRSKACQANIKSYFLCMTESNQRVKILKNPDGTPRNFTEGDPVYISTTDDGSEEPERSSSRTMLRVSAPHPGRDPGPSHFDELTAFDGERPGSAPSRRGRKVVEYFWIPTDQE
ncbi:hypothetical protein CCH79_00011838 [Gambusia affinis]|uniref:Uncharacterized protein n=1 Tax=Gambusia affinis TaxID=33528 RepID=A0A315VNF4_GAMAF|nr:hypothetical protein CCH79_00011838 [Gambusia affinis]